MKRRLLNLLSMFRTVQAYLEDHVILWGTVPALVAAVAELKTHLDAIDGYEQTRTSGTKGATNVKRNAKTAMLASAHTIAGAVRAFASKTNDGVLFAKVNYSASSLKAIRDAEIANVCQVIHDAANANLAALADYSVTAPTLAAFQSQISAYSDHSTGPREKRSANRAATEMLKVEFAAAERVLTEQIDGLLAAFEKSLPEFFAGYRAVREIIDIPGRKKSKSPAPPVPTPEPVPA
jgi:hypothetical protein